VAHGDPVYTARGDMRVLIWDYDDRSYLGLIITANGPQGQVIKRKIFMDKNLDMNRIKMFTDHFRDSPDQSDIL
jgi:hypothetical protein